MLVKDVMNKNVFVARANTRITEIAKKMTKNHIGSLIIVNPKGRINGIVTERDILTDIVSKGKDLKKVKAKHVMTKQVITVDPEMKLEEAIQLMLEKKIKKLPVVEKNKIIGIITERDIVAVEPKLICRIRNLLTIRPLRRRYFSIKRRLNTVLGSIQIFLGLISVFGIYVFFGQNNLLGPILLEEPVKSLAPFTTLLIGGFFLLSGSILVSIET